MDNDQSNRDEPADNPDLSTEIAPGARLVVMRDISKIYALRSEEVYALRDVNLEILRGEYLSIMGPSGSGKSTLLNIIGALDRPSRGEIRIGPLDLTKLSSRQLAYVRSNYIGYVFQAYNLIASQTAPKERRPAAAVCWCQCGRRGRSRAAETGAGGSWSSIDPSPRRTFGGAATAGGHRTRARE